MTVMSMGRPGLLGREAGRLGKSRMMLTSIWNVVTVIQGGVKTQGTNRMLGKLNFRVKIFF